MSQVDEPTMIHDRVAELARANILRMRGNYSQARQLCNVILNAYPEDVETYALLAEICTDEGDLDTAAHWYDLARDKDPGNNKIQVRAQMLHQRINDNNTRQVSQSMAAIQVPTVQKSQQRVWSVVAGLGVVVFGTLLGLYLLSPKKPNPASTPVTQPISIPRPSTPLKPNSPSTSESGPLAVNTPVTEKQNPFDYALPSTPPEEGKIAEDEQALVFFTKHCADGDRILMVQQQPSNKELNVTFRVDPKDEMEYIAARIAVDILKNSTKAPKVNLRAVLDKSLYFAAEATRQDFDELKKNGRLDESNPDPEVLLINVWKKHPEDENGPKSGG